MIFVDVLTLREGKSLADSNSYFSKALPILQRHGFRRLKLYKIQGKMRGHDAVNPSIVQIWETAGPSGFQAMGGDADYKALVPLRDSIFDMDALQGWFAEES